VEEEVSGCETILLGIEKSRVIIILDRTGILELHRYQEMAITRQCHGNHISPAMMYMHNRRGTAGITVVPLLGYIEKHAGWAPVKVRVWAHY
jgi:hypothetical protein